MPTYRYYANQQTKKDYNPETGEYTYFMPGDEIPLERFGSGQALRAALHRNQISAVAQADSTVAASPQATLAAASSAEKDRAEAAADDSSKSKKASGG